MASLTDSQRQFWAAHLGLTEAQLAAKSSSELLQLFNDKQFQPKVTPAAAIAAPSAPSALYNQAEAASAVAAINSLRNAIKNAGITL